MATTTADDFLMVYGDAGVDVDDRRCDAPRTLMQAAHRWIVDGGTQHHRVSAAINNPAVCGTQEGTQRIVRACVAHAEQDLASEQSP